MRLAAFDAAIRVGRRAGGSLALGCIAFAMLSPAAAGVGGAAHTHRIAIKGLRYVPDTLTVRRGDTVIWINKDPFPHTVTAAGVFDSKTIAAGKSFRWQARRAGHHAYVCTLHSTMTGTLTVE